MMADEEKFENVQLVGRRVPDFQMNKDGNGNMVATPLPGEYEVGMMFGKKFHSLARFQAGNVLTAEGEHVEPAGKKSASKDEPSDESV